VQKDRSMLTFEKDPFQGTASIIEKLSVSWDIRSVVGRGWSDTTLQNLPFQKVQHRVDTVDAQPSNETGGILVLVTGALMVSHPRCGDTTYPVRGDQWLTVVGGRWMINLNR